MLKRFLAIFHSGPIINSNADLARIMTESHKTYMDAAEKLRAQMSAQKSDMDDAHKYIAALQVVTPASEKTA